MARNKHQDHIPFDTLSYAKRLEAAGFTREQAEIQAETFLDIVQDQLVSKQDFRKLDVKIEEVRRDLEVKIEEVRRDLKVDIENLRKDLSIELENIRKDIHQLDSNTQTQIHQLDNKTQTQMELLRRDLKIWFGGMLVVAVSVLTGMMTLIVHVSH